jgi:polyisoprenoid-binding protein YceI
MVRLFTACFVLFGSIGYGQNKFQVDSSSISFQIKNAGLNVNGTFSGLEAQINFNPKKFKSSSIVATIDAASVDTGIRIRNNHLRRADYFNVDAYPRIGVQSNNFQQKERGEFIGNFTVKIKGKEGVVLMPFTYENDGNFFVLKGNFVIDRTDYDIGGKSILLDDSVKIDIWIKVKKN